MPQHELCVIDPECKAFEFKMTNLPSDVPAINASCRWEVGDAETVVDGKGVVPAPEKSCCTITFYYDLPEDVKYFNMCAIGEAIVDAAEKFATKDVAADGASK